MAAAGPVHSRLRPWRLDCGGLAKASEDARQFPLPSLQACLPGGSMHQEDGGAHFMLPALKEGATALRTAFQCSSVCPVSRLVPPRNCMATR